MLFSLISREQALAKAQQHAQNMDEMKARQVQVQKYD